MVQLCKYQNCLLKMKHFIAGSHKLTVNDKIIVWSRTKAGLASRRWSKKTATGDDVGRRLNLIGLVIIIRLRPHHIFVRFLLSLQISLQKRQIRPGLQNINILHKGITLPPENKTFMLKVKIWKRAMNF